MLYRFNLKKAIVCVFFFVNIFGWAAPFSVAEEKSQADTLTTTINDFNHAIKQNTNDISEIRRDEINYRVEKDNLKEIYSTVIQAIQIVISVVLAGMTVVGYLGLRSTDRLRENYSKELEEMQKLKSSLQNEIELLQKKQESTESEVRKIEENQNSKIELLELVEKAGASLSSGNFDWAMERLKIALEINPDYPQALRLSALCHMRMGNIDFAIDIYRKIFDKGANNANDALDYAEFLLIAGKIDDYDRLYRQHESSMRAYSDGNAVAFLSIMRSIQVGNLTEAKQLLRESAEKSAAGNSAKMPGWNFADVNTCALAMANESAKALAAQAIAFFSGGLSREFVLENVHVG